METYPQAFNSSRTLDDQRIEDWVHRILSCRFHPASRHWFLDIGCGVGRFLSPIANHFGASVGIDHDPDMLRSARMRCTAQNINLVRASALALPLKSRCIDLALASMVMEHISDRPRFLAELERVLAPAGTIVVRTMLPENIQDTTWYKYCPEARDIEAARTPSLDDVSRLAHAAGLSCEFVECVVEQVGKDINLDKLSKRIRTGAYEALRRVQSSTVASAADCVERDESHGMIVEVLSSSLLRLRSR